MHFVTLVLATLIQLTTARWASNLNYRSPSEHHPGLGVSLNKVVKRNSAEHCWKANQLSFTHGVASGDPYHDSVILWTRLAPHKDNDDSNVTVSGYVPLYNHETDEYVKASRCPICAEYSVAEDPQFDQVVDSGVIYTSSDIDYTYKVEARKLSPFTQYYYQFKACGSDNTSPVGRAKTAPAPNDDASKVRLAVYSCSNWPFGFFPSYGNVAHKDSVDYVVHLGDVIYEQPGNDLGNSIGRVPQPNKDLFSLYEYRRRHAQYRTDKDLLANTQNFTWIPVWDDHEVADNGYRDGSATIRNNEASFVRDGGVSVDQRKMNAVRAYFEWLPIRQVDMDDNLRIWRTFSIGNLLDLIMLDTRQYDRSITDLYWNTNYVHMISNDAGRSLMGPRQETWFYDELSRSADRGAAWRVIGNQIIFSRLNQSFDLGDQNPFNYDAWDGYVSNRNRTLAHLYNNNIGNNIMLSGDSHASWASDLAWLGEKPYDAKTGEGAIGVEFGGSAISSPCPIAPCDKASALDASQWVTQANPELQWSDYFYRGYYELYVTHAKVEAKFYGTPKLLKRNALEIALANFTVHSGENRLARPVANGVVEFGALQEGETIQTGWTVNTKTGKGFVAKQAVDEALYTQPGQG